MSLFQDQCDRAGAAGAKTDVARGAAAQLLVANAGAGDARMRVLDTWYLHARTSTDVSAADVVAVRQDAIALRAWVCEWRRVYADRYLLERCGAAAPPAVAKRNAVSSGNKFVWSVLDEYFVLRRQGGGASTAHRRGTPLKRVLQRVFDLLGGQRGAKAHRASTAAPSAASSAAARSSNVQLESLGAARASVSGMALEAAASPRAGGARSDGEESVDDDDGDSNMMNNRSDGDTEDGSEADDDGSGSGSGSEDEDGWLHHGDGGDGSSTCSRTRTTRAQGDDREARVRGTDCGSDADTRSGAAPLDKSSSTESGSGSSSMGGSSSGSSRGSGSGPASEPRRAPVRGASRSAALAALRNDAAAVDASSPTVLTKRKRVGGSGGRQAAHGDEAPPVKRAALRRAVPATTIEQLATEQLLRRDGAVPVSVELSSASRTALLAAAAAATKQKRHRQHNAGRRSFAIPPSSIAPSVWTEVLQNVEPVLTRYLRKPQLVDLDVIRVPANAQPQELHRDHALGGGLSTCFALSLEPSRPLGTRFVKGSHHDLEVAGAMANAEEGGTLPPLPAGIEARAKPLGAAAVLYDTSVIHGGAANRCAAADTKRIFLTCIDGALPTEVRTLLIGHVHGSGTTPLPLSALLPAGKS